MKTNQSLSSQMPNRIGTGLVSSKALMGDAVRFLEALLKVNEMRERNRKDQRKKR